MNGPTRWPQHSCGEFRMSPLTRSVRDKYIKKRQLKKVYVGGPYYHDITTTIVDNKAVTDALGGQIKEEEKDHRNETSNKSDATLHQTIPSVGCSSVDAVAQRFCSHRVRVGNSTARPGNIDQHGLEHGGIHDLSALSKNIKQQERDVQLPHAPEHSVAVATAQRWS